MSFEYGRDYPDDLMEYDQLGPDLSGHPLLAGMRTGKWLDAQTFPALRWAVEGVLPEGMALIVGPPKAGKSWMVLGCALSVAAGKPALGKLDAGPARNVLYLAMEDGDRRMQGRCRALLGKDAIPENFTYITRVQPGMVFETVEAWLDKFPCEAPLIIVDTLGKVMPPAAPGESSYQRDYRVGGRLKKISDDNPGSTVLVVHHDRKASTEDFVDSVSGTHGLAGAADTIIVLSRPRGENGGLLKVTGRDVPEGEYSVIQQANHAWEIAGGDLDSAAAFARQARTTANLGDRSSEIVAYVNQHPEGVTPADVQKALDFDRARDYLARLAESGRIVKVARGRYGPVATVASVAFEDDDPPNATDDTEDTQLHLAVVKP